MIHDLIISMVFLSMIIAPALVVMHVDGPEEECEPATQPSRARQPHLA